VTVGVGERYAVRVMVTTAWEQVPLQVDASTTVAQLKHSGRPGRGSQCSLHRAARPAATGAMSTYAFTRAVTIFAVGFLLLNAVLLAMIDQLVWAAVFAGVALLAIVGWFWFRRAMAELVDARKEMKREIESLRDLLHTHRKE